MNRSSDEPTSNVATQKVLAWSGPLLVVSFFIGFWVVGGFVPPPSPQDSARETAEWYQENSTQIRLGLLITMFSATLFGPWTVSIFLQMRRIEGSVAPLAYLQLVLGAVFILEFIFPLMIWQTAAYRPSGAAEGTQRLNDMGWLWFLGVVSTAVLQAVVIGACILLDKRETPVFPRWAGYTNFWLSLLFVPGGLVVFFRDGPFAWNGLLAWWVLAAGFCAWVLLMSTLVLRALNRQGEAERGVLV
jgi:hypothetical protein